MNRKRALFWAFGIGSLAAFGACSTTPDTVPPPAGYVPNYGDGGQGGDSSTKHDGSTSSSSSGGGSGSGSGSSSGSGSGSSSGAGSDSGTPGCAGGTCLNPSCQVWGDAGAADIGTYASLGFEINPTTTQPAYIPNDVIIPTFDDVPDGPQTTGPGWTNLDLQLLDGYNMHVDFFINTNNWCGDVTKVPECTNDILDILAKHNPANHTVYHPHMGAADLTGTNGNPDGCADASDCASELTGVETVINTMSNGTLPHLTRFRMPYGEPQQSAVNCADPSTCVSMVEGVVAQFAVGIGWNFDSGDSSGATYTGASLATQVEGYVGNAPGDGYWGIILQHGVYQWTHDAIPILYDPKTGYFPTHGFRIGTVEDAICWKYGMHSWEIVQQLTGQQRAPN
jgi:peptidoglycan/xylan/chitin deacetylase (PgdA/CDA1 family)